MRIAECVTTLSVTYGATNLACGLGHIKPSPLGKVAALADG